MGNAMVRLEVLARGDPLRQERLTCELYNVLATDNALAGTDIKVSSAPPAAALPGSKGTVETIIALLVAGVPYAQPAADVLTSAIERWCSRDERVVVRIKDGDRTAEIVGNPTDEQREMLDEFWRGRGGDGASQP